jgi:hypothetical protein
MFLDPRQGGVQKAGWPPDYHLPGGESVLTSGSRTGRLLILKKGAVSVVKEEIEIANEAEPGAVFGELSVLLDQPHTADVRTLKRSEFYVPDAAAVQDPIILLCVSAILAQPPANSSFRGSITHPTQPLCTLRVRRYRPSRNRPSRRLARPYLGRTCTG